MIAMLLNTAAGRAAVFALIGFLAVGAAFTGGFWKGWATAGAGKDAAVRLAVTDRDTYWQNTISAENAKHEEQLAEALAASMQVTAVSGGRDGLVRLCNDPATNADCRSKGSDRLQGVRPAVVGR